MRAIIVFLCFIALAYLSGAILAYPLKLALDPFLIFEYRKYINYATLLSGLLISGIYLKTSSLLSWQAFGFSGSAGNYFKLLARAFLYGILIMLAIELILYVLGIHEADPRRSHTLDVFVIRLIKAVFAGLLVSLLEEAIFRGGLFSGLQKHTGTLITVGLTSALYSAVHFVRYEEIPEGMEPGWFTGIAMMPDAFRRFYEWSILDYSLTLFMFGVVLALMRLRHGTIAGCLGLHAGVVAAVKLADYYGERTHASQYEFLVSQYNSTFGWISFSVMSLIAVVYYFRFFRQGKI